MDKIKWLGLYFADGRRKTYPSLTNTNPQLILFYIKILKKLGIPASCLKARIQISKKYKKIQNEEKLIDYWSKVTGIPPKNFWKTGWVKTKSQYKRNRKQPPCYGEIEVAYLSRRFLKQIKEEIQEILKSKDPEIIAEFLKGVFAGDGFVKLRKNGKLQEIRIGCQYEKEIICCLLKKIGIEPGKPQKFDIPIYGKKNFEKIKKLKLLELSSEKLTKFLVGFKALCNGE